MEHRVNYIKDLIVDCRSALDAHPDEPAFEDPEDRAKVICALILADAMNGLRRALTGGK
jgi:hypothetical protein